MKDLLLYTTLGCHLCEDAKAIIWPQLQAHGFRLVEVEISDSDQQLQTYGLRIPVVARELSASTDAGSGLVRELDWPFTAEQLAELLSLA